jgi:hypothetical protein
MAGGVPRWIAEQIPEVVAWESLGEQEWRGRLHETCLYRWCFLLVGEHGFTQTLADEAPGIDEDRIFRKLAARLEYLSLPPCVVPGCTEKGRVTFTANDDGRLAGHLWQPGDKIDLCAPHGADVFRAHGVYERDQLAEWLRPDARPGLLEELDRANGMTDVAEAGHVIRMALDREIAQ